MAHSQSLPGKNQSSIPLRENCAPKHPQLNSMAATDLVPCFYTGQNYRCEKPIKVHTRAEVREFKKMKLGEFVEHGKLFLFFQKVAERLKQIWDGPLGVGNLLPFARPRSSGDKLHYEIPHAGDRSLYARHHRRLLSVSARNQIWPARGPQFRFQNLANVIG